MEDLKSKIQQWHQVFEEHFSLSRIQIVIMLILALLILSGGVILYLRSRPTIVQSSQLESLRSSKISANKPKRATAKTIFVHVAGAVNNPGVYRLKAGDRVIEAVKKAGGETSQANLDALNLAAKVLDGEKIFVPTVSQNSTKPVDSQLPIIDNRIPINQASAEELEKLDGIGPILAKRIISYRQSHGGFASLSELKNVPGIGAKKFSSLKGEIRLN